VHVSACQMGEGVVQADQDRGCCCSRQYDCLLDCRIVLMTSFDVMWAGTKQWSPGLSITGPPVLLGAIFATCSNSHAGAIKSQARASKRHFEGECFAVVTIASFEPVVHMACEFGS
jgi:hypothetical protein